MNFDARRTQVAQSAHDFSVYFAQTFAGVRLQGAVVRRPEMVAPEGMSTGAGKRARQSICLRDERGASPVLTVGWVDIPQRRAGLRTHRCLLAMHQARFRDRPFDLHEGSYNAFFDQAKGLLGACGLFVTEEDEAPAAISTPPPPPGRVIREAGASTDTFWTTAAVAFIAFVVGTFAGGLAVYARFVGF
ncbi:MAG: hypothetical protein HOW73_42240 [Polyangiaceae bacterium]|nr:hypothetical protein [Polyangiaceae bacterium]